MRRTWTAAAGLALVVTLGGCAEEERGRSVELDPPATASASPEAADASAVPENPPESGLARGLDPASSPDEQLVTDTWFRYWTELTRMYSEVSVDPTTFGELASRGAYDGPVSYVERLEGSGNRNRGGSIASVEELKVAGDRATVTGCQRTTLAEVTAEGAPAEFPVPFLRTRETLERTGEGWVVVNHEVLSESEPCTYR